MPKKLLVIDDEAMILDALKVIMEDMGHCVATYSDAREGERAALAGDYDLVITDLRMPGRNGAEITRTILERKPRQKILLITAYPADPLLGQALDAGAVGVLKKPFEIAKILDFLGGGRAS